jgi:hypothetical protein
MRKLFSMMIMLATVSVSAEEVSVTSPDGKLAVNITCNGGHLTYAVSLEGKQMLLPSALGLTTSIGDFTDGLTVKDVKRETVKRHYSMYGTKTTETDYEAGSLLLNCQNVGGQQMAVRFQVSNRDVAFRYELPRQTIKRREMKRAVITSEKSSFRLPDATTTFISPQIGPETGWEQTKPSYEEGYSSDAPMTAESQYHHGYVFPALFHTPDGWVLISETGVSSAYCGSHLSDFSAALGYTIAYPDRGENNSYGTEYAAIPLPGVTPWRTITVGTTLKPIVETTVSYDVVDEQYSPSTAYKPGRYTWSWLIWQDKSINYDDQVKFIDLASTMGFEYCLVDNWWDTQIGRDRIAELSRYAQSKGVNLLLWYNSNGFWNDAPQGPRNCMHTAIARDKEMKWMKSIGVKGIKVDFFGGDKQETMRLYEDILCDANRYGLQVVFHGCTVPRGWEKMYTNFVASEAVLASENVYFNEGAANRQAYDLTLHPFCRNATASMDWGGIIMNRYMAPDNKSRHQRKTTDIFELASGIIMQTPVQCVAMQPNNLQELPEFELDFLKQLPTTWEEVQYLDGYPTHYVVLARKSTAGKWYIAGLNANDKPLTLKLMLPMMAGQTVQMYVDEPQKKGPSVPVLKTLKVGKNGEAKVTIQPLGGIILI